MELEAIARSGKPFMINVEAVSGYLSALKGGEFRQGEVRQYPIPKDEVRAFLYSSDARADALTPYLHVVWIDRQDGVHIETERLGNTSDTTEWMYGEKSLYEFVNMDLTGFEKASVRQEYAQKFPRVVRRLESYQRYVAKMSTKLGVRMDLILNGGKGIAAFWLAGQFEGKGMTTAVLLREIDRNVAALKQVYYEIVERQEKLYWIYALPANRKGTPEED